MKLADLVKYLDTYLHIQEIGDSSQNGLQVAGPEEVKRLACAVDCCQETIERAIAAGAQLLIVHHGLFWDKPARLVGPLFRRVRTLIEGNCALYAAHLPLDMHPEVGNNAELCRLLGLKDVRPFGRYHGNDIGLGGRLEQPLPVEALVYRLKQGTGESVQRVVHYGPERATWVGCISGGGAMMIPEVAQAGFDTFVTGETSHAYHHYAAEYGLNVIYGGHYATETLGVRALSRHLVERFDLEMEFIPLPTGL